MSDPTVSAPGVPGAELPPGEAGTPPPRPASPEPDPATPEADPLDALADDAVWPEPTAEDDARQLLGPQTVADLGRLGELAVWWASMRGSARAAVPERVLLVGGTTDAATRRPGVRVTALPRGGNVTDAVAWGVATADAAADEGIDLVLLSFAEPETTRALAVELLGIDVVEASGWPDERGLSDEAWMDATAALRDRVRRTRGVAGRPTALVRALASPAAAAATALAVRAAARRTPLLLDGPGAAAIALLARRTVYSTSAWWQAAHLGDDRLHERMLAALGLAPLVRLGIRVEDGTAAVAGLALLDLAAGLLADATVTTATDDDA